MLAINSRLPCVIMVNVIDKFLSFEYLFILCMAKQGSSGDQGLPSCPQTLKIPLPTGILDAVISSWNQLMAVPSPYSSIYLSHITYKSLLSPSPPPIISFYSLLFLSHSDLTPWRTSTTSLYNDPSHWFVASIDKVLKQLWNCWMFLLFMEPSLI